jgi:hypothetical protein
MKTMLTAALMLSAASLATLATAAQPEITETPPVERVDPDPADAGEKPGDNAMPETGTAAMSSVTSNPAQYADARSLASDADVGQARRAYRAACERGEAVAFCECVSPPVSRRP